MRVSVVTPSLNKSFKFQSDWPYNNSQVYLLSSLLDDISNDEDRKFESTDEGYIFTSTVNYPNNDKLVNQKVYFGDDYLPKKVEVLDKDGNVQIKMSFDKIDLNTEYNDTYFDLNSLMDTDNIKTRDNNDITNNNSNSNKNDNSNLNKNKDEKDDTTTLEPGKNKTDSSTENKTDEKSNSTNEGKDKTTATIDDIIYPMYLPTNTYLTNQERVSTDDGERLILTFTGDSSFILVEQTAKYSDNPEIIPTYGSVELIGNALAVINDNSANWFDNGIEYYLVSDTMKSDELLQVVKSISVIPVSK